MYVQDLGLTHFCLKAEVEKKRKGQSKIQIMRYNEYVASQITSVYTIAFKKIARGIIEPTGYNTVCHKQINSQTNKIITYLSFSTPETNLPIVHIGRITGWYCFIVCRRVGCFRIRHIKEILRLKNLDLSDKVALCY